MTTSIGSTVPEVPVPLVQGSVPRLWSLWTDRDGTGWRVTGAFAASPVNKPRLILLEAQNGRVRREPVEMFSNGTYRTSTK